MIEQWIPQSDGRWLRTRTPEPGDEEVVQPPPEVTEHDVDPKHPAIPVVIASAASRAVAAGWAVRLTWARGPKKRINPVRYEQTDTMVLRCSKPPGRRVVLCWARQPDGSWKSDGAYDGVYHPCTVNEAKAEILR